MQSNDTNKSSNRQARDGFFIISKQAWHDLFKLVTEHKNDTQAARILSVYLTICCGTDATHQKSTWSGGAIYKRVGISNDASKKDIQWLSEFGFIRIEKAAQKNVSPDYRVEFFGNDPTDTESTDNIYIPNGIVSGVSGEPSPLRMLRDAHNPHLIYLFIRLYAYQDKYLDVIDPDFISTAVDKRNNLNAEMLYKASKEVGSIRVWALPKSNKSSIRPNPKTDFYDFTQHPADNNPFLSDDHQSGSWGFIALLIELGLLEVVTHICNGEMTHSADEIEHIAIVEDSNEMNPQVQQAALLSCYEDKPIAIKLQTEYRLAVVLPANYRKVHYQYFLKMRYRTKAGAVKQRIKADTALQTKVNKMLKAFDLKEGGII